MRLPNLAAWTQVRSRRHMYYGKVASTTPVAGQTALIDALELPPVRADVDDTGRINKGACVISRRSGQPPVTTCSPPANLHRRVPLRFSRPDRRLMIGRYELIPIQLLNHQVVASSPRALRPLFPQHPPPAGHRSDLPLPFVHSPMPSRLVCPLFHPVHCL